MFRDHQSHLVSSGNAHQFQELHKSATCAKCRILTSLLSSNFGFLHFAFVLGPQPEVLRHYCWLCKGITSDGALRTLWDLRIQPERIMGKASPAHCAIAPAHFEFS